MTRIRLYYLVLFLLPLLFANAIIYYIVKDNIADLLQYIFVLIFLIFCVIWKMIKRNKSKDSDSIKVIVEEVKRHIRKNFQKR